MVHECFSEHGIFSMESVIAMLTDTKLRNLKPQEKLYRVNDRDVLYVAVTAAGSISFRYNYSIKGRQVTPPVRIAAVQSLAGKLDGLN